MKEKSILERLIEEAEEKKLLQALRNKNKKSLKEVVDNLKKQKSQISIEMYDQLNIRNKILIRDDFKCVYCSASESLCIDHIIPKSRGGGDSESNLQVLCQRCNLIKSDK